ncbi:MAG: hypothetical protein ACFFC1_10515 [Promethearchaeota archaeon]
MTDLEKLEEVVKKEIRALASEFRKRNGNAFIKIPNKDFNLWLVSKMLEEDGRITKNDTRIRMLMWLIGIGIPAMGVICAIIKL